MNKNLKSLLRAAAAICIWGGPVFGLLGFLGSFIGDAEPYRWAVGLLAGAYFAIGGLLIGGLLRLLLSIDDRLERLEGKT